MFFGPPVDIGLRFRGHGFRHPFFLDPETRGPSMPKGKTFGASDSGFAGPTIMIQTQTSGTANTSAGF